MGYTIHTKIEFESHFRADSLFSKNIERCFRLRCKLFENEHKNDRKSSIFILPYSVLRIFFLCVPKGFWASSFLMYSLRWDRFSQDPLSVCDANAICTGLKWFQQQLFLAVSVEVH